MKCRRGLRRRIAPFAMMLLFVACSRERTGEQIEPKEDEFERLARISSENLAKSEPVADTMLQALYAAAAKKSWSEGREPGQAIVARFPDDELSLYLVEHEWNRMRANDDTDAASYLDSLITTLPDSASLAKAVYLKLSSFMGSPVEQENLCNEFLGDEYSPRIRRAALYQRFLARVANRKEDLAALDGLRLLAEYRDAIHRMGAEERILGELRHAGLYLETDMLSRQSDPSSLAQLLLNEFSSALAADSMSSTKAYLMCRFYDDWQKLKAPSGEAPPITPVAPFEEALLQLRLARLALEDPKRSEEIGNHLTDAIARLDGQTFEPGSSKILVDAIDAALNAIRKTYRNRAMSMAVGRAKPTLRLVDALRRLPRTGLRLREDVGVSANFEDIAAYASILIDLGDNDGAIEWYREVLQKHRNDSIGPLISVAIGDVYLEHVENPAAAAREYSALYTNYPEIPNGPEIRLKTASALISANLHDQAYEVLFEFIADRPDDHRIPLARYMSALCEASMGLGDQAFDHMNAITAEFPKENVAPRALYWMGSYLVSQSEYARAQLIFEDLLARYPESELGASAREMSQRLEDADHRAP